MCKLCDWTNAMRDAIDAEQKKQGMTNADTDKIVSYLLGMSFVFQDASREHIEECREEMQKGMMQAARDMLTRDLQQIADELSDMNVEGMTRQ